MSEPRPERIAALARALGPELLERLALFADAIAASLGDELGLVAWDREQLIGQAQARQWRLREQRFPSHGGPPVRIIERRQQPLECIEPVWRHLRQGRRVRLEHEPGTCSAVIALMRGMSRMLGPGVLSVADVPTPSADDRHGDWPVVGVEPATSRIALVDDDADRELAAYVLARSCLRRSGLDPRGIRQAVVVGERSRLERHMQRLWVGVRIGPASDPGSFAGPVDERAVEAFLAAHAAWQEHERVTVLCEGGLLERSGDDGSYLAPALFRLDPPMPDLPVVGPMLVLVPSSFEHAREVFEAAGHAGRGRVHFGARPDRARDPYGSVRSIRGALVVERLPPGLPEPRPA